MLKILPNPNKTPYTVKIRAAEFTNLCPFNPDLPDFGVLEIEYCPDKHIFEFQSFRIYLHSYRNVEIMHEEVVAKILNDLVSEVRPLSMKIRGTWNMRGGTQTTVEAEYNG